MTLGARVVSQKGENYKDESEVEVKEYGVKGMMGVKKLTSEIA